MGVVCSTLAGEQKCTYKFVVGTLEGKRTHGRTRHRKKNTKRDVQEIEWKGAVWINITQHKINLLALIKAVMNYRMLYNAVIVLAPKDHLPM